jgi:protein TonB
LQFRSTDNSIFPAVDPWVLSSLLHGIVLAVALVVFGVSQHRKTIDVNIEIIEAPKAALLPIQMTEPKTQPKRPVAHEVFGISPKSVASDQGVAVKAGNTLAKTPDQETLKPGDLDSLPIPSDEYLVTSMPALRSEVRIAYPKKSRIKGIQGPVVMDLLIDAEGKVREAVLVEGPNQELSEAALSAAKGFQFGPALIRNKPVAVRIRYVYRFVLER